jgi:hypothetical protein
MELLGDMGQVVAHFSLFGDNVILGAGSVHGLRRMFHWIQNYFGRTRWYSYVTWVKW